MSQAVTALLAWQIKVEQRLRIDDLDLLPRLRQYRPLRPDRVIWAQQLRGTRRIGYEFGSA